MIHLKNLSNNNLRLFRNALAVGCLPYLFTVAPRYHRACRLHLATSTRL
jgi:hypothetical protein